MYIYYRCITSHSYYDEFDVWPDNCVDRLEMLPYQFVYIWCCYEDFCGSPSMPKHWNVTCRVSLSTCRLSNTMGRDNSSY